MNRHGGMAEHAARPAGDGGGWVKARTLLVEELDERALVSALVSRLVPDMCDWAVVYNARGHVLERLAVAHVDPAREHLARELRERCAKELPVAGTPLERVLLQGEPVLAERVDAAFVRSIARDPRHAEIIQNLGIRSVMFVPMVSRGRVRGALALVMGDSGRDFDAAQLEEAVDFGRRAGVALDNARLYGAEREAREAAERRAARLARLHGITTALAQASTPEQVAGTLLEEMMREAGATAGLVAARSRARGEKGLLAQRGEGAERLLRWWTREATAAYPVADGLRSQRPVAVSSRSALEHHGMRDDARHETWVAIPLHANGEVVAAVVIAFGSPRAFSEEDLAFMETVAGEAAQALGRAFALKSAVDEVEERTRVERVLREQEMWLRAIYDSLDEAVFLVEYPARVIRQVNSAAERMLGYASSELVGRNSSFLFTDGDRYYEFGRRMAAAFERGETATFEYELRRRDGTIIPTEHVLTLLLDEAGHRLGLLSVVRDLTERKRTDAALAAARAEVEHSEKLSALGSLVGGVAHELRTPLTYLQNNLYLLSLQLDRRDDAGPEEERARRETAIRRAIAESLEAADRINHLVEDLRRFTRLKPGGREPIDLAVPVHEAVELFRSTNRGGARVDAYLAPVPPVPADRVQVQQVLLNLLQNAAEAQPAGGSIRVRLAGPGDDGVALVVEDDGPGIPPDVAERMFDPFFTTKSEGTGLGLGIVRRIMEEHGGALRCESPPGGGARFVATFPIAPREKKTEN